MGEPHPAGHHSRLVLPALRAHLGDWTYYVATMQLSDVASRVRMAQEIHESRSLNELIQHSLEKRAIGIARYLITQEQRFFNALVVGVYGGDPNWYDIRVRDNPHLRPQEIPDYVMDSIGILTFDGNELLFALDGQHRVKGIAEALKTHPELGSEQLSTIFVAHSRTPSGLLRTRRLFTTLNRYAKPVTRRDTIALDEDDAIAILTRKLIEQYPLFSSEKLSLSHGQNLPLSSTRSFTTIIALYNVMDIVLRALEKRTPKQWNHFKRLRPSDDDLERLYGLSIEFWDGLRARLPEIDEMASCSPDEEVGGRYRNRAGGHLLFRPVGLTAFAWALGRVIGRGHTMRAMLNRLCAAPMDLAESPWRGLLWNPGSRRMITASDNKKLAIRVLEHGAVGSSRAAASTLRRDLANLLDQPIEAVRLKRFKGIRPVSARRAQRARVPKLR